MTTAVGHLSQELVASLQGEKIVSLVTKLQASTIF
jgi:hypothetical protein